MLISVNDVYEGTFKYICEVAGENQGLEATFLGLENVGDEEILGAIRETTKVTLFLVISTSVNHLLAHLDRITNQPYVTSDRHPTHRQTRTFIPI